jgi:hypothetical protein
VRGTKDSILVTRIGSPNRKRYRNEYLPDNSSDDPDNSDDADYGRESSGENARGNSVPSRRLKRVRRPTVRLKPRSPRYNTTRIVVKEAV